MQLFTTLQHFNECSASVAWNNGCFDFVHWGARGWRTVGSKLCRDYWVFVLTAGGLGGWAFWPRAGNHQHNISLSICSLLDNIHPHQPCAFLAFDRGGPCVFDEETTHTPKENRTEGKKIQRKQSCGQSRCSNDARESDWVANAHYTQYTTDHNKTRWVSPQGTLVERPS